MKNDLGVRIAYFAQILCLCDFTVLLWFYQLSGYWRWMFVTLMCSVSLYDFMMTVSSWDVITQKLHLSHQERKTESTCRHSYKCIVIEIKWLPEAKTVDTIKLEVWKIPPKSFKTAFFVKVQSLCLQFWIR